jgi:phage gp29-like protein
VSTPSNVGISKVGYGILYDVAQYEILARNLLGNNADAAELYGMPMRVGKTQKTTEDERQNFFSALLSMGATGAILLDAMDEIELVESKGMGQGYKIYPDLEKRLEQKISKIILGHADALDSTSGKLGASQGEESPTAQALEDKQSSDGRFLERVVNDNLIPKLIELGFVIDTDYKFCFGNNAELIEERKREDANNKVTADIALTMTQAGLQMDATYFQERTGIPTMAAAPKVVEPLSEQVKNKLKALYR